MVPGGLTDGLQDGVDPVREPGADSGTPLPHRARRLVHGAPPRRPVTHMRSPAAAPERDRRRGDATAGSLHENGVTRADARLDEEHPIRRQPRRRQAGGLGPGSSGDLATRLRRGHGDPLGQRALVHLGEQRPSRVRGLVSATCSGSAMTPWMTTSLPSSSTPAASQPRIIGSALGRKAHPAQRPQVVVVEGGRSHGHHCPAGGRLRVGSLAHLEGGQRVLGRQTVGVRSKHPPTLSGLHGGVDNVSISIYRECHVIHT